MTYVEVEITTYRSILHAVKMEFGSIEKLMCSHIHSLSDYCVTNNLIDNTHLIQHLFLDYDGFICLPERIGSNLTFYKPEGLYKRNIRDTNVKTIRVRVPTRYMNELPRCFKSLENFLEHWYIGFNIYEPFYHFIRDNYIFNISFEHIIEEDINQEYPTLSVSLISMYNDYKEYYINAKPESKEKMSKAKFIRILSACGFKVVSISGVQTVLHVIEIPN